MPPSTRPSSSQSSIHQHLKKLHAPEHPAVKLAKQHPPAPQTACPPAPGRQARKAASTSTSNCMPPSTQPSSSQSSIHQHLKLHAPWHPALNLAKQHPPAPQTACPLAPGQLAKQHPPAAQTACPQHPAVKLAKQHPPAPEAACPPPGRQARKAASTSTPNCMPRSTRKAAPTSTPNCIAPRPQSRKAASTSTSNCMPPSTRPSSSQSSIHQHLKLHAP